MSDKDNGKLTQGGRVLLRLIGGVFLIFPVTALQQKFLPELTGVTSYLFSCGVIMAYYLNL